LPFLLQLLDHFLWSNNCLASNLLQPKQAFLQWHEICVNLNSFVLYRLWHMTTAKFAAPITAEQEQKFLLSSIFMTSD